MTTQQTITLKGDASELHARTTLVLYHRDGATVAHLLQGRPLVVGRAAPADVEIHDPGLSRQHARFTWDEHGIWVEDLGSTNGTKKNGEAIRRAVVLPGDDIAIGPVRVSVHVVSSIDQQLRGFDGHDRFLGTLEDELTRARLFGRPLALLLVRGANAQDAHVSRWASRLRARLRPVDRVGIYGPAAVLVALPEATPEAAQALARELAGGSPALTCRLASFPQDGGSAEELVAALRVASRAGPAPAARAKDDVIVENAAMKQVMAMVQRLAGSPIAVLLHGETGTGKEVIARAIHERGPRKQHPLCTINCAAIPGTLIESMLFGHEQGAFTSADKSARGIFEQADGGTVLLDEIGELTAAAQAALLRVLETKQVTRVGGHKTIQVDVRVIAATHRDLEAMVAAGRFRQDLLYRLNSMTLTIPPLRDRVDEIKPLALRFLRAASEQAGSSVRTIEPAALAVLERYAWPGNVRELRNVIERALVLAEGKAITLDDLTDKIRGAAAPDDDGDPLDVAGASGAPDDYKERIRRYEASLIVKALHKSGGNQTEAAKALGLSLRTLVHKIKLYGITKKFG